MLSLIKASSRKFGAMNQINPLMFEHSFTTDLNLKSWGEKIPCFRVIDCDGKVINKGGYERLISS
jgi:hypothetical protein